MLEPEYRVGFQVLRKEIGHWSTFRVVAAAALKSLRIDYGTDEDLEEAERTKVEIKNHFKLLALTCRELQKQYGTQRTNEIMHEVLMKGGQVFFQGLRPSVPMTTLRILH